MGAPTEVEKAYTAGFFDGDGTINCGWSGPGGSFKVSVSITQKDRECLDWLVTKFGGRVVPERDRYWRWIPTNKEAFLRAIEPYLILKGERVRRVLTVYYDVAALRWGSRGLPPEELQRRKDLVIWFKAITLATTGKPSVGR